MKITAWLEARYEPSTNRRYWCRTPMGLESLAANEIAEQVTVADCFESHRNLLVRLPADDKGANLSLLYRLRTADDVFEYLGCCRGVTRSRDSVGLIVDWLRGILPALLPEISGYPCIRTTVSFVGRRNFNRYAVEEGLNAVIAAATRVRVLSNEQQEPKVDGEIRLRCHIEEDVAFFGLSLRDTPLHRRPWREIRYPGQLHPPVAAAMAALLRPAAGDQIIDPFCGSGTILVEAAIRHPQCTFLGMDIHEEAVEIARQSAALAEVQARIVIADFLAQSPPAAVYYMVSNPPWDEKHRIADEDWEPLLENLVEWIDKSSGAVLLLPEDLAGSLTAQVNHPAERIAQTRIRGKLAWIVRFTTDRPPA